MTSHFHGPVAQVAGGHIFNGTAKDDIANLEKSALSALVNKEKRHYFGLQCNRFWSPATFGLLVGHAAAIAALALMFPAVLSGQLSAFALLACLLPAGAGIAWFRLHLRRVEAKLTPIATRIATLELELARRL